jgi:HD-like signal output (HDOD) protein
MEHGTQIHRLIGQIKNLPPLPQASTKIITAVNDPDISIEELVSVISLSPVLVGRLIGLANSAYFGRTGQVNDLRLAIIQVLGLNLVKSLALSLELNVALDTSKCRQFNGKKFWATALITATLAQKISLRIKKYDFDPSVVYTSGLLLDIGLLAAVYVLPAELNEILATAENNDIVLEVLMKEALGDDHYQAGFLLLNHWHLPEIYQTVLHQFTNEGYQDEGVELIRLLRICSSIAKDLYLQRQKEAVASCKNLTAFGLQEIVIQQVLNGLTDKIENINELAISINGK